MNAAPQSGSTLADVGEFGTIDRLTALLTQGEAVLIGPGDDAAEVVVGGGRVVVSTDVLVDGRHFRRDWVDAVDIGRRAAAQSLSDLNAMGGRATAVTVGIAAPADLAVSWVEEMTSGLAEECALVGASVVGGDLTRSDVLVISVTAVGEVAGDPVRRSGARPGDVVALCGRQGWAAAGLAVLGRGFRSPRAVVEAYRRPEVPYGAGPEALALGATSLVDISDGLVADAGHVAEASGVVIDLRRGAFELADPLQAVGAALGVDPFGFVLGGGDDHPLLATFPPGTDLPASWQRIGEVRAAAADSDGEDVDAAGSVLVDGARWGGPTGYRHF